MKKHLNKIKLGFINLVNNVYKYFKRIILLPINRIIVFHPLIVRFIITYRYKKLFKKLQIHNKQQSFKISDAELKKGIIHTYFSIPINNRQFIKDYIIGSFMVAETNYKFKKAQPRNSLCNCGSGKKFKKCCMLKY